MYNVSTKIIQTKRRGIEVFTALFLVNGKIEYKTEFLSKGLAIAWLTKKTNNFKGLV
jgi:hypothetical protein